MSNESFDYGYEDMADAYMNGACNADELFDQDPEDAVATAGGPTTEWDDDYMRRLRIVNPDSSFLSAEDEAVLSDATQNKNGATEPATSQSAADTLVTSNLRFAAMFARDSMNFPTRSDRRRWRAKYAPGTIALYASANLPFSDRLQAANIGLIRAVDTNDSSRGGVKTLARFSMESELGKAIAQASLDYTARIPYDIQQEFRRINRSLNQAYTENRLPNMDETVFEAGLPEDRILAHLSTQTIVRTISLQEIDTIRESEYKRDDYDAHHPDDDVVYKVSEYLRDEDYDTFLEDKKFAIDFAPILAQTLDALEPRSRFAVETRFGIDGRHGSETFRVIGEKLGVTRERARIIVAAAVARLRNLNVRGNLEAYFYEHDDAPHSGVGTSLYLSDAEKILLRLRDTPVFDYSPSKKYRDITTKPKFFYQEDWF